MRLIEKYIIQFKEDFKIAETCKNIRTNLLEAITNGEYFSEELAAYFVKDNPNAPFKVLPTDPSQVAVLKKLLNALERVETAMNAIEGLNISRNRYSILYYADLAKAAYTAVHEISAALQIINHSSSDVQDIVAPHIKELMPKIAVAANALEQISSSQVEEKAGAALSGIIKMLPEGKRTEGQSLESLSTLIFELPHYFEELQKLIATGASGISTKSITSAEDYQAAMLQKAKETKQYFEKLTTKSGILALPSYLSVISKLVAHSSELLNTAAPLTKQAYLDAADKLNEIKHELLPQLLAEIEKLEEGMSLKPGTLTDPVLKQMNSYYAQLATQVDAIAQAAGVLDTSVDYLDTSAGTVVRFLVGDKVKLDVGEKIVPIVDLTVMMDDQFVEKRRGNQVTRLNEARSVAQDDTAEQAATRFFDRLNSYNRIHQSLCKWSLANVSQSEKEAFLTDYKQFQSHFAALHPEIDKLIVDALTQTIGSNVVSRLYSSEYKQIWGANHFSKILECKSGVLERITQSKAQAEFKAKLIDNILSHAEQVAYEANNKKTVLITTVQPYTEHEYTFEANKSAKYYHDKGIAVANKISQLEGAQEGSKEFFDYLKKYSFQGKPPRISVTDEPLYKSLTVEDKEFLRVEYKKFQPYLIAMGYDNLNEHLVDILNSPTPHDPKDPPMRLSYLLMQHIAIDDDLKQAVKRAQQDKNAYLEKEREAQGIEYKDEPLKAKGAELGKKTLFGMLSELKLSKSIDDFLQNKFQNYLKENLSPIVWEQLSKDGQLDLDSKNLPYQDLHKDSPIKRLINAMHQLKLGLKGLEDLNNHGDPTSTVYRIRYAYAAFNALLVNINGSKFQLVEAAKNPGLKAIIQEALDLLDPIKNIPVLGDYLATSDEQQPEDTPVVDIVKEWEDQQAIVKRCLSPKRVSTTPSVEMNNEEKAEEKTVQSESKPSVPKKETSYVQLIAEQLYQLPLEIKRFKGEDEASLPSSDAVKAQVKGFVDGLSGLSFGPAAAKSVLNTISKFQMQLSEIGSLSRDVAMDNLKEIRSEFGVLFMEAADSVEFHLGLKPGTYSDTVKKRFDQFYEGLIGNLPFKKDQEGLMLLFDLTDTQKRLDREKVRKESVLTDNRASLTKEKLFSHNYEEFNTTYQAIGALGTVSEQCDPTNVDLFSSNFLTLRDRASEAYASIQHLLEQIDPEKFPVDLIDSITDEADLKNAVDSILAEQDKILNASTVFEKLQLLALDSDFESEADQKKFLAYYAEIQPYLGKVSYDYNLNSYLRELQTPEDFRTQAKNIISEVPKIKELIQELENEKALKVALCNERIKYFEDKIKDHKENIAPEKIAAFKDKVFSNYVNANLLSALEVEFGSQAENFFKFISPKIFEKKAEILEGINIEDDMEAEIAMGINDVSKTIIDENKEPFKEELFKQNIYATVGRSTNAVLGFYTTLFIEAVLPEYNQSKAGILSKISFDKDMGGTISRAIDSLSPTVLAQNKNLKEAFANLNITLKRINLLIENGQALSDANPCREQKLAMLTGMQAYLMDMSSMPQENKEEFLNEMNETAENALKEVDKYDALIYIYEVLDSLKEKIQGESESPQEKEKRILAISVIQEGLVDKTKGLEVCLDEAMKKLRDSSVEASVDTTSNYWVGEAYKGQAFDHYLNVTLTEQMEGDLGPYTATFIQQITDDFMSQKSEIIKRISVTYDIDYQIARESLNHKDKVYENHQEIKEVSAFLNQSLKTINRLRVEEENKLKDHPGNPGREEKINKFKQAQKILLDTESIPEHGTVAYLKERKQGVQKLLKNLSYYDSIIKVHDGLSAMQSYIERNESSVAIKTAKGQQITIMQDILQNPTMRPAERLREVKVHGLSKGCQDLLQKNSDNPFIKLIKKFVSFFTGPTQEETMMLSFKQRLQEIKEPSFEIVEDSKEQSHINLNM